MAARVAMRMHGFNQSPDTLTMVADPETHEPGSQIETVRRVRSERLLTALSPFQPSGSSSPTSIPIPTRWQACWA